MICSQRKGTFYPSEDLLTKLSAQYERRRDLLREREQAKGDADPQAHIDAVLAEIAAENDGDKLR